MNSAAEYRKLVAKRRAERPTEQVKMPSGFVWELRPPDLEGEMMLGRIPHSLVDVGLKAMNQKDVKVSDVKSEDVTENLIYMRETVRQACVNPKIVMGASKPDEIDPSEIDPEDFRFIFKWCMTYGGVRGVAGLETFRKEQASRANPVSTHGKKLRRKTVASGKGAGRKSSAGLRHAGNDQADDDGQREGKETVGSGSRRAGRSGVGAGR
jgi:hypothetical protein